MKSTEPPIVVANTYNVPVSKLWSAITKVDEMRQWYFDMLEDFQAVVGFTTSFLVENEGRQFTHLWEITEVVEESRIKYQWNYKEHIGDSYVLFELEKISAEQSSLTVSCVVEEDFPDDLKEFDRESGVAGWTYLLKQRLVDYLDPI